MEVGLGEGFYLFNFFLESERVEFGDVFGGEEGGHIITNNDI